MEHADLGGRAHVRAAAQLARVGAVADLDHAHDLAVLLAEQRHRAEALGLLEGGGDRAHGVVGGDPRVDGVLDVAQLLRAERARVREVEAQLVRADVGAGLADVGAEALAQRGVQQVGGGVVALGRVPCRVVHAREHGLAPRASAPCSQRRPRAPGRRRAERRSRRAPGSRRRCTFDRADVGDLAAAGGIERRLGELDQQRCRPRPATAPTVVG